jgi:hypothetical protein
MVRCERKYMAWTVRGLHVSIQMKDWSGLVHMPSEKSQPEWQVP